MVKSIIKRPVVILLVIVMFFSLAYLVTNIIAHAAGSSSNLADFIVGTPTIEDPSQSPPIPVGPGSPPIVGQNYIFNINFAESTQLQLAYNSSGRLTYQLPAALIMQAAVPQSPIYFGTGTIRVGWYTIDTSGLVQVWFDNVNNAGNSTPGNFIDNYTNVQFRLQITAQFGSSGDGNLDFGNGIVVTVPPPQPPPQKLTVTKSSDYIQNEERINYTITIKNETPITSANSPPITNISFVDEPTINGAPISNTPDNAFFGMRWALNGSTTFNPMTVAWPSTNPALFTYSFGSNVMLYPQEYITIYYYLDIPRLCRNNGIDPLVYDFQIGNIVTAKDDSGLHDTDNENDHVWKTFPITKAGAYTPGPPGYGYIRWTITAGPTTSALNAGGVGGVINDNLIGSDLLLPPAAQINVTLFDASLNLVFTGTADLLPTFVINSPASFTFTIPLDTEINPDTPPAVFGPIYRVIIVYDTQLTTPPPSHPGIPPITYENDVNYYGHGSVGRVPFNPPAIPITKKSSGICGGYLLPDGSISDYYIDYEIDFTVPAGLYGQNLYIYDTMGGNMAANSLALTDFTLTSSEPTLPYSPPDISGNTWTVNLCQVSSIRAPSGSNQWLYTFPVDIKITYRMYLSAQTVTNLMTGSSYHITNSVYLINSAIYPPSLSGAAQNNVGGTSVNDYWPIFKAREYTNNPALFNYTVTMNGAYSGRPNSLLQTVLPDGSMAPKNPVFSESFNYRLSYVPGSFYVWDSGTNRFYAPGPGADVSLVTNGFNINLNTLWQYTSPPSPTGSSEPGGTPIGTSPADPGWYTGKRNYIVHYQLILGSQYLGTAASGLNNKATITVNAGQCTFDNSASVDYTPVPLNKTMATDNDIAHVEIIINQDGGTIFSDGVHPGPAQVTVKDVLTNMLVYMDQIKVYTQTKVGAYWDGNWILQPVSYNDYALWSVNVVNPTTFEFVIPNQQPVKIEYDALITLEQGVPEDIKNEVSVGGITDDAGRDGYEVTGSTAGAQANAIPVRLFKRDINPDPLGNTMFLPDAEFTLYITDLEYNTAPSGVTSTPETINGVNFYPLVLNQTTNAFGMIVFSDPYIQRTDHFLFMLKETNWPQGYTAGSQNPNPFEGYTFFTVKPDINTTWLNNAVDAINAWIPSGGSIEVNSISDFITIDNTPDPGLAGSLRLWKRFTGIDITDPHYQQQLQNFWITISGGPRNVQYVFTLADAINPFGIVIPNIEAGTYFIQETGADTVDGYNWMTIPAFPLPNNMIRFNVMPDSTREVLIQLNNVYTVPPIELPPGLIAPPETLFIHKIVNGLTGTQITQNLQNARIVITGPNGFNESISLIDAINGYAFNDVQEGTYFFNEVNTDVPGYYYITNPSIPFRRYIMPSASRGIVIQIENNYSVTPPPTPPPTEQAPKTGDTRGIIIPLLILGVGAVCITGAEVYRRKFKKDKK